MSDQTALDVGIPTSPSITVVLKRPELMLALPPSLFGSAYRGGDDDKIVVFDNPVGQPPRRLQIWVASDPASDEACLIGVNIDITRERYVLIGIGERQFRAPLSSANTSASRVGEAIVSGVPLALIIDPTAPDFKLALLP